MRSGLFTRVDPMKAPGRLAVAPELLLPAGTSSDPAEPGASAGEPVEQGAIQTEKLRRHMLVAFLLTIAVLVALGLSVSVALLRMRGTTTEVLATQTRSIRLLSRLRGQREAGRQLAEDLVLRGRGVGLPGRVAAARRSFDEEAAAFEATLSEPAQIDSWRANKETTDRFWALVEKASAAAQGDRQLDALELVAQVNVASHDADLADEALVRIDARRADRLASSTDRQVYGLSLFSLLAMLAAVLATAFLLQQALQALRAYSTHMSLRLEDLDLFAGRVVHDMRQPLTSLSLILAATRRSVVDPAIATSLDRGQSMIQRLSRMAEDLLNFSRSGLVQERAMTTSPQDTVLQLVEEARARPEASGIEWKLDLPPAVRIPMGVGYFHMAVWNLIDNAVKYLGQAPSKCITLRLEQHGDHSALVIRDTGPGIPDALLAKIFQPFYRATAVGSGYGLGLATVKRLVDAHGGRVEVLSVVGRGTQFTLLFPAPREGKGLALD